MHVIFMVVLQLQSQCEFLKLLWLSQTGPVTDKNALFLVHVNWAEIVSEGKNKR